MEKKKRKHLASQVTMIIVLLVAIPLFVVLTGFISWMMYRNIVDKHLGERNTDFSATLEEIDEDMSTWLDDQIDPEEAKAANAWYFTYWAEHPEQMRKGVGPDEEELEQHSEYVAQLTQDTTLLYNYDWLVSLPEETQNFLAREVYYSFPEALHFYRRAINYDFAFCMDMTESNRGMLFFSYDAEKYADKLHSNDDITREELIANGRCGDRCQIDFTKHPALKKIAETGSADVVTERSTDLPRKGSFYIMYKPIIINGELRAVWGIVYDWGQFNGYIKRVIIISVIAIALFILIVIFLLHLVIHKLAIKPVTDIEQALVQYTDDKDSKKIVKEMYDIKSKNEIGQLADIISDLALELDLYTKENVRIATEHERAEKELYEAKVQIMVSQIRPHFMYNTLSSIAMLCKLDPDTAYTAAINFSDYLRCNMDSLKQTAPVPFSKELDHLKKYLYIEKLRFDDLLNIEYDIQATDFKIPLLSIQPIVENAVKHGVGMKENGGTVKIATRETETAYEIIVSDDGVGFDTSAPKKEDGRSHVGMENTKKRLKDLCNADIVITSKVGEGTTATITIPKMKNEEESQL